MEISNREATEALDDCALSATEEGLVLLVIETEVAYQQDSLVKELFTVFLLVRCFHCVEDDVVE